jgi:DNA (cytosine-5)-methyltransferase 1
MLDRNLSPRSSEPSPGIEGNERPLIPSALDLKTFAEFFAGIGLMRMGLEKEGWSASFANDIDEQKLQMYKAHFGAEDDLFLREDIHKIPFVTIPTVTLATASFPCNDLSLAGARNGLAGEHSSAFWGFVSLLNKMQERKPRLVLVENVPGFLTSHGGKDFEKALLALNGIGYSVDPFIVDAAFFVPQSRKRLFVVGILKEKGANRPEQQLFANSELRPPSLSNFILSNPQISWTIRSLPRLRKRRLQLTDILEPLPESAPEWWNGERSEYLLNQMSPRHRSIADRMISGENWSYGTVFRRIRNSRSMAELRIDGLAGCLRTPRGGSGRQILFKAGKGQFFVRLLTPRECARLLGAGNYKIDSPVNQALFGFGDAVCVPVIRWIARNYLNPVLQEIFLEDSLRTNVKKEAAVA